MNKNQRFSPFTISQNATLSAYTSLVNYSGGGPLTITVPSGRGQVHSHRSGGSAFEDLPEAIESWTQTIKDYGRIWDADKIKEVTDVVKDALDEGKGEYVTYEITFHKDSEDGFELDTVIPEGYPTMGNRSTGFRSYTEKVTVQTTDKNKPFGTLTELRDKVNQKTNINPKSGLDRGTKEKSYKEINERMKADASYDKGYKDAIDRAFGRERTMWA